MSLPKSNADVNYQMAKLVDLHFVAGINQNRRAHFFDHGGPLEPIAVLETAAQIDRAWHRFSFKDDRPSAALAAVFARVTLKPGAICCQIDRAPIIARLTIITGSLGAEWP